ncbi:acyl-CoA dehydrogenase family protein [Nonomuraea sp. GTA35]|uniref:acyl-CoA dehydrogenase family protein n=1 Tax=Nonomuraea sp. GTA35 TaxID=1676746 RepID=UPI0035C1EFC7
MTAVTHAPGAPPEPALTPDEIVARAEAMVPALVARQAETEQRTYYARDTHEAFAQAGFYRILVPRRFGGYEFGVETFLRVSMTLARGCPSTGWMYSLGTAHALAVATLFGERAQAELFATGDFVCPATVAPSGAATRGQDGQWILDGTWNYCSGAPYATHFMGHVVVDGAPMLFVAPRDRWRRLDDWGNQLGLKGSGSHSVVFEHASIPGHYTLPLHLSQTSVAGGTPGLSLHGNPEYGGGPLSFMLLDSATVMLGMAKGALDAYEELMRVRTTVFPPFSLRAEDPDYQFWYGEAAGLLATAEAAWSDAIRQWQRACVQGAFTRERDLRIATISREIARLSWRAVERCLFPTAGSSAVRNGERIERIWRDMSTLHSHAGFAVFLSTVANRELARAHFGLG